jgi:hypothetical protein
MMELDGVVKLMNKNGRGWNSKHQAEEDDAYQLYAVARAGTLEP